ncbi:hypothetical protein B7494_g1326 [Chlorociboria aeruginascens]|nr:hypothetical protein B7494_g1326 [Chlorociboria aeruginascens]
MPSAQPFIPSTQTAIIAIEKGKLAIAHDVKLPELEPDMVIVLNKYVALNPADAKMVDYSAAPGAIAGYDFAGEIVAIGSAVTRPLAIGDRVCGMVHGMNILALRVGSFAQYVGATADFVIKIPDAMSYASAVALGTGIATAGLALFHYMKIPATPEKPAEEPFFVIVYGASTASGTMALQLLKLSGLRPIAICSPHNFALVESYGAEKCFDYNSSTCAEDVRAYTNNRCKYALDCITEAATMTICYAAIGRTGGNYCGLEPFPERQHTRKIIKPDWVLGLTIYGKKVALDGVYGRDPLPDDYEFGKEWFAVSQRLLNAGRVRSHPVREGNGGFEGVLGAVDGLRRGGVSGYKLVYAIA